jgi:hypothetical protein
MKAITVRQPWAYAIMSLGKDIENRDWYTRFRGRVAIHAAKGVTRYEYEDACAFIGNIIHGAQNRVVEIPQYEELTRGAIIGTIEIVDCVKDADSLWFQGDYGFVLKNRKHIFPPIPCQGALGFWDVPQDIALRLEEAI